MFLYVGFVVLTMYVLCITEWSVSHFPWNFFRCNAFGFTINSLYLPYFRYQSLVGTIAKKFTKRRHKSGIVEPDESDKVTVGKRAKDDGVPKAKKKKTQKKFLKPQDDWLCLGWCIYCWSWLGADGVLAEVQLWYIIPAVQTIEWQCRLFTWDASTVHV